MASTPQPQETWTNSWTCWTSGLLEERDQSLDWDLTPTSTMTSNILPRLDQKQSGPFDSEWTDRTLDNGFENLTDMEKSSLSLEEMSLSQMLDFGMPADVHNMSEDDFLNNFMDLSEFLLPEQPIEEVEEVQNVIRIEALPEPQILVEPVPQEDIVCEEVTSPIGSVKREFGDTDLMDLDWNSISDHDYVTKKPRLSPSPDVDSTKTTRSTQSTTKSSVRKPTPDQKYRERRIKNNIASKRSREIRKMKFSEMEEEANRLVIVNEELREKITEMEKVAKDMKALLIQKLAAK